MLRTHHAVALLSIALIASCVCAQEIVEPELLFRASFDRLTANADFAAGNPESTLTESLELRARPGVVGNAFDLFNATPGAAVLGGVIGYGAFRVVDIVFLKLRGVEGLGQGDAKLLAAIGAWFGWPVLPPVVFLAAIMALIGVGISALRGASIGRETPIPFGPALAAAGAAAMIAHGMRLPFFS